MAGGRLSTGKSGRVNKWLSTAHDWFLPANCVLCGRAGDQGRDLCGACAAELPYLKDACQHCAIPLPHAGICGQCLKNPPSFDAAYAVFDYQPPLAQLIQGLKFNGKLYNARLLGGLMAERFAQMEFSLPELLIPVPLANDRLRERGFNQALELARPLAKALNVPISANYCRRVRPTTPQTGLDAKARQQNLRGAFEVRLREPVEHVAIVDDVMTTASTAEMLARSLKRAGVGRVEVWLCARAALHI